MWRRVKERRTYIASHRTDQVGRNSFIGTRASAESCSWTGREMVLYSFWMRSTFRGRFTSYLLVAAEAQRKFHVPHFIHSVRVFLPTITSSPICLTSRDEMKSMCGRSFGMGLMLPMIPGNYPTMAAEA